MTTTATEVLESANGHVIGIGPDNYISAGWDNGIQITDEYGEDTINLPHPERRALAAIMIARWQAWAELPDSYFIEETQMTLKYIDAVFACDHCNATFSADIDPAYRPSKTLHWSVYDIAIDAVRGGHPGRTGAYGFASIQADMHLCPKCTKIADAYGPEDCNLTRTEVLQALAAAKP